MALVSRYLNHNDWRLTTSASGSYVFTDDGKTVNLSASAGGAAYMLNSIVAFPGDSFEFSVLARNIETGKDGWAELIIDSPPGTRRSEARVDNSSLSYKTLRYDVPLAASGPRVVDFGLGVDTPTSGSGEFVAPRVDKIRGDDNFLSATLSIPTGGGCTILDSVKSFNARNGNILWDATNIRFSVTPSETTSTLFAYGNKPILTASASSGNSNIKPISWNIEGIGSDGSFYIQAIDDQGARMDLSASDALRPNLYVTVKLSII